jgi:hypothetical protein
MLTISMAIERFGLSRLVPGTGIAMIAAIAYLMATTGSGT